MPWHIERRDGRFCVIKNDDGDNEGCHDSEDEAKRQMRALYASETEGRAEERPPAPVETRDATLAGVNFAQRLIEVVAVPYDEEAIVEYRGELWHESFAPGAFDGLEKRPGRIKAYLGHQKNDRDLVGKAVRFSPDRTEGLVSEIRVARTPLGEEVLTLADDDMLGVSVGFAARPSDQVFDRTSQQRKIKRAFLDHVAFVSESAYDNARVLSVRDRRQPVPTAAAELPPLDTPNLNEVVAWMQSRQRG